MPGTITAANAVFTLAVNGVFNVAQQLQQFSADDVFDTEAVESAEIMMGVDGHLSAGFVFVAVKQSITLQADSPSNLIFEAWQQAQKTARDLFFAQGGVILPSVGRAYTMTRGVLTSYPPIPDAKKVLQPRKYGITWESVSPAAI